MLNKQKGNMYGFVTHTWNTVKGQCYHDCVYCYMKRFGNLKPVRFDEQELNTDLGSDNFIFVGSSCDMWAKNIPSNWIVDTLVHCMKFNNRYLFQSKNPKRFLDFNYPDNSILCTTIETTLYYDLSKAPDIYERFIFIEMLRREKNYKTMITLEPLLEFDLSSMLEMLQWAKPDFVNIGADSKGHGLPEPSADKIKTLILELEKFTKVYQKPNLKRLL